MIEQICDSLTRIRNALRRDKVRVILKRNKGVIKMLEFLVNKRLIPGFRIKERELICFLRTDNSDYRIRNLRASSKPSVKRYLTFKELSNKSFLDGFYLLSTSRGWKDSFECLGERLGGLLVCHVSLRNFRKKFKSDREV